ncbi:hypothetical protein [Sphingobium sp.]|nr:hypothetical protein [Sphingobium sp.]HUD90637.1 hypothetical protein [Sphingobium sp.]
MIFIVAVMFRSFALKSRIFLHFIAYSRPFIAMQHESKGSIAVRPVSP